MRYVISDIHGEYSLFVELMQKIGFSENDDLYICGDIIEKGDDSVKLLKLISEMPNVHAIRGNHEEAFLNYYYALTREKDDYDFVLEELREYIPGDGKLLTWELVEFIESLPYYIETDDFICVHAGVTLDDNGIVQMLETVPIEELLYNRKFKSPDVLPQNSKCVFYGHTSSMSVFGDARIVEFYRTEEKPNNIKDYIKVHMDTGVFTSGVLACFCIDTCTSHFVTKRKLLESSNKLKENKMYYPPDIENLRNRENEKYVSIRDIVESSHFDSNEYRIPFALGMENGEPRALDVSRASPIFIGEQGGSPHTEVLWNFLALTTLTRSPEEVRLVLIDPYGLDLKFAKKLPHTIIYAHEPQEIIGALMLLEEEISKRENGNDERIPIVVVISGISAVYSRAPKLHKQALETLFQRGSAVNVFSLCTLGLDQSLFCRDFAVERTRLPNKIILEPYERDIIGLIEEAIYRNRKIEDKNWNEKYIAKVAEAKVRLEKYQAEKEEQNCCILAHFFDSLKILEDHKKINTAFIQRKLRVGYGTAAKIIDSLLALSLIKKSENDARYYCLNTDDKELSEIINAYINK